MWQRGSLSLQIMWALYLFLFFLFASLFYCLHFIHEKKVLSAGVLGCKTSPAYYLPHSSGFQSGEIGEDVWRRHFGWFTEWQSVGQRAVCVDPCCISGPNVMAQPFFIFEVSMILAGGTAFFSLFLWTGSRRADTLSIAALNAIRAWEFFLWYLYQCRH